MFHPKILFYESNKLVLQSIKPNLSEIKKIDYPNSLESILDEFDTSSAANIVFLDMKDPKLNPQWISSLLNKSPKTEIVLLNSSSHHNSLIRMMEIGVSHFLPLGYTSSQIKLLIQQVSRKYSSKETAVIPSFKDQTRGD
ncbi:hypothetical protein MJH12_08135, partial [bacterium]|nr:hypothetical protein [bacterium]